MHWHIKITLNNKQVKELVMICSYFNDNCVALGCKKMLGYLCTAKGEDTILRLSFVPS
jgi:hypothetical protein